MFFVLAWRAAADINKSRKIQSILIHLTQLGLGSFLSTLFGLIFLLYPLCLVCLASLMTYSSHKFMVSYSSVSQTFYLNSLGQYWAAKTQL